MSRLPRVAVGTIQPGADPQPMLWALMEVFRRHDIRVQHFLSRACFPAYAGAAAITGLSARHLDSWLMSPETCRDLFVRGAQSADLALVEGRFDADDGDGVTGGELDPLCQWLDLPRLAVVDARELDGCRFPQRPAETDALLLDRVSDDRQMERLWTDLEAIWGIPVVGALKLLPRVQAQLETIRDGESLPRELCEQLGDQLISHWRPRRILEIANRREMIKVCSRRCCSVVPQAKLTVAIAYDEAFHCYFPDTLELLELWGASVVDFSPLRDETLPPGTDIVYLGCGHPERFAAALADNHCMKAALRSHVRAGRRIYGEGGGAAYLCQQLQTPEGDWKRMTGLLPAAARFSDRASPARPVEASLLRSSWLGHRGARLRGYRNAHWQFESAGNLTGLLAEEDHRYDVVGGFHAIGSLLHLHFAAQPESLRQFFFPQGQEPQSLDPWTPK